MRNILSGARDGVEALLYRSIAGPNAKLPGRKSLREHGLRTVREQWWQQSQYECAWQYWRMLFLLEQTDEPAPGTSAACEAENIVVYSPGHLGDILLTVPLMRGLRKRFPASNIKWLVGVWSLELAKRFSYPSCVEEFSPAWYQYTRGRSRKRLREHAAWSRSVAELRPDVFISTSPTTLDTLFVGRSCRPRRWIGREPAFSPYRIAWHQELFGPDPEFPEVRDILRMATSLGVDQEDARLEYPLDHDSIDSTKNLLLQHEFPFDAPYVVLSPGAGWEGKQWPAHRWSNIIAFLERKGVRVIIAGSSADIPLAKQILDSSDVSALDLTGKTSFNSLAGLIAKALLWIGNDCGAMHLASALMIPTIGLFGPTNPDKWAPCSGRHLSIRSEQPCAGCVPWHPRSVCAYHSRCMKSIDPEAVIGGIDVFLTERAILP